MDIERALTWEPTDGRHRIDVIDAHTGGEPFRVVVGGIPSIPGATMLERRQNAIRDFDDWRRLLMWEPRGHADMYGGLLGEPVEADSDVSVLFMHNEGFSTMCGHGIIALAKVAFDTGMVNDPAQSGRLSIDTPAGQVRSWSQIEGGSVTQTSFLNVPSFVTDLDAEVNVPSLGSVGYDLAFGGAFYAYVDAETLGLSLDDPVRLIHVGRLIKAALVEDREFQHPEHPELGFLYGVIFTGPPMGSGATSRNVCVFADGEIDRSPTGTGVSGRVAIAAARGESTHMVVESLVGSIFTGDVDSTATVGSAAAVVPRITGSAHILGRSTYWLDPNDELGSGFFLR